VCCAIALRCYAVPSLGYEQLCVAYLLPDVASRFVVPLCRRETWRRFAFALLCSSPRCFAFTVLGPANPAVPWRWAADSELPLPCVSLTCQTVALRFTGRPVRDGVPQGHA
jgi:hypothetical protein